LKKNGSNLGNLISYYKKKYSEVVSPKQPLDVSTIDILNNDMFTAFWNKFKMYCAEEIDTLNFSMWLKWSPKIHLEFSKEKRDRAKTILMMSLSKNGQPTFPETSFYKLPCEVLFNIISMVMETY